MKKSFVFILASAVAAVALARTFEVAAWRGETVAAAVPDYAELAPAPAGISVRYGVLKSVKFAPVPHSMLRHEAYDLVEWGSSANGPRVVEVSVPADAKPGVYEFGMMRVRVIDRVLPPAKEWKYYLDLWQHPWATARTAGAKPFSKEHYAAMRPVYELLATAGQKTITVPIVDMPWDHQCFDAYHSMIEDPDYRLFDEYVQFCLDCGLGPDISCYSLCPWTLGKTIDADRSQWTNAKTNPDGSKIMPWLSRPWADLATKGRIGFQGMHGGAKPYFRNVKIGPAK